MIHMPHRSVTRFFVPLIDVLLLLFVIFLLMPIADETQLDKSREVSSELAEERDVLADELESRSKELDKYAEYLPKLMEIAALQEEIERLKKLLRASPQQKYDFQIIDIDGKTGDISYYDPNLPTQKAKISIASEDDAKKLIERHQKEAGEKREVYYHFLYPRPQGGYPTVAQVRKYKQWFGSVSNSLQ